jgi:hypothetical protein
MYPAGALAQVLGVPFTTVSNQPPAAEPGYTKVHKYTAALTGSRGQLAIEGMCRLNGPGVRVLNCNDAKVEAISHYIKNSTGSLFMLRRTDMMDICRCSV